MAGFVWFSPDFGKSAGTPQRGVSALLGRWVGVVHGLRHTVTHGGAATLRRPVLLYNFVLAKRM